MRAGSASAPAVDAWAALSETDAIKVAERLEWAMKLDYPGGTRDPLLWEEVLPDLEGPLGDCHGLSPAGVRAVAARLRALPPGPLSPECKLWLPVLKFLLPEQFYPLPADAPTRHAPGSPAKIKELTRRAELKRDLHHGGDARKVDPLLAGASVPGPEKNYRKAGGGRGISERRHRAMRAAEAGHIAKSAGGAAARFRRSLDDGLGNGFGTH